MDDFVKILNTRHAYAREWKKRTGGRVLGYFETYVPEELIYAAGLLPVRILAQHEPDDVSDRQTYGNCYCTKDMLCQFVGGRYDYVDGLVNAEGCQWIFHAYQSILNNRPELFNHYVFVPDYPNAKTSKTTLRSEMQVFKEHLEQWTGKAITEADLDNAIDIYNRHRRLLRRLYELRKADNLVVKGSEVMEVMLACQVMDKAEANEMLEKLLPELEARAPMRDGIRLMLTGSETYDASLEKLVESLGANIVIDDVDNGSSYCWNEVILQSDRLMALALRYLERPHHAVKDNNWRRRPEHIFQLCEDFGVDGVIIAKQIYCHPHGTDNYMVWKLLRERKIPFHYLECVTTLPDADTRLRLEAFFNMLRPGVNRLAGLNKISDFSAVVHY